MLPGSVVVGNPTIGMSSVQTLVENRVALAREHPEYFLSVLGNLNDSNRSGR